MPAFVKLVVCDTVKHYVQWEYVPLYLLQAWVREELEKVTVKLKSEG